MSEQETQDSVIFPEYIVVAEPVKYPAIIDKPDCRSTVDKKKQTETAPKPDREFSDGQKIMKENPQGVREYVVHVVSARYDEERKEWMYKLTDWEGKPMLGETEETKLG